MLLSSELGEAMLHIELSARARAQLLAALLNISALAMPCAASAQSTLVTPPPTFTTVDPNGVDLLTGAFNVSSIDLTIGQPGSGGLVFGRTFIGTGWRHNYVGSIDEGGEGLIVSIGGVSEEMVETSPGNYASAQGSGATLVEDGGVYTYTMSNGAVAIFGDNYIDFDAGINADSGMLNSITYPSGEVWEFHYRAIDIILGERRRVVRLQSVTNNFGYQLHFDYAIDVVDEYADLAPFALLTSVTAINNAVTYCGPVADDCTGSWPTVTYSSGSGTQTVSDAAGRQTRYTFSGQRITGIRRATGSGADPNHITIAYSSDRVSSVSNGDGAWSYAYSDDGDERTTTVTDPMSHTRVVVSDLTTSRVNSDTDGEGRTVSYTYDDNDRVETIRGPEDDNDEYIQTAFEYDVRGNIITTTITPKSSSGLSPIVIDTTYMEGPLVTACSNIVTCNLRLTTEDALGNVTEYTYDSTHGGVLTVTAPDPDAGGSLVRPQTRFAYTALAAYYKNSGGSIVAAPGSVYRLTSISSCATTSSCASGADETVTTIGYGSTGVANNRQPLSQTTASGTGLLSVTTTFTYDNIGNVLTIDGPLSDDTTYLVYDDARQLTGTIGPDPDGGGGALLRRATRRTYNGDGQVTLAQQGTVTSTTAWTGWNSLQELATTYDYVGRPVRRSLSAGATTFSVIQMSYDDASRVDCVAVRMNPASFASLPSSACTHSTAGAFGPDRIAQTTYNGANQAETLTYSDGPTIEIVEWERAYGSTGLPITLEDAGGNITGYAYDGFDRLRRIYFPSAGGGTSTTDYEQFTYDDASNVVEQRRRDGATLTYAYDDLNRVISVTPSANGASITYEYDNFSRLVEAATSGRTLSYSYDQLSRLLSETQSPLGTVSYQWDLAGRRTRITWPDSVCAQYTYNLTNELTQVTAEDGSCNTTTLATFAYDNLGRRTGVTRNPGGVATTETASFDGASRLTELIQNLVGTSQDVTFEYAYDPAGVLVEREASNSSYVFTPLSPGTTSYADNGLNQYTSIGGSAQSYDSRGNLNTGTTLAYDIFNRLITGPSFVELSYDAQGRLYRATHKISEPAIVRTRFLYDGAQIIAEYDDDNILQRRYIPGAGLDEHVAWYEGAGTTDRRWYAADERGSIIAILNGSGAAASINTFDEYGIRGAANAGRFQFTGQPWLPGVNLYHFRARVYSPTLGRFLQTDPIVQAGGMNLYGYASNSPISRMDPLGLQDAPDEPVDVIGCGRQCRWVISQLLEWLAQRGPTVNDFDEMLEQIANAQVCGAFEDYMTFLMGPAGEHVEAPWRGAPGSYTFARLQAQGSFFGAGRGVSVTRYTHEVTGARTYVVQWNATFGAPMRGNPTTVRDYADLARRLPAGGIGAMYGAASDPGSASFGFESSLLSLLSGSLALDGNGAFELGIGAGWGNGFNLAGDDKKQASMTCED
jgi:RHS repeat-associated protein